MMKRDWFSIVCATFLGVFMGGTSAYALIEITGWTLWFMPVAAALGGCIAWCAVDADGVRSGSRRAWSGVKRHFNPKNARLAVLSMVAVMGGSFVLCLSSLFAVFLLIYCDESLGVHMSLIGIGALVALGGLTAGAVGFVTAPFIMLAQWNKASALVCRMRLGVSLITHANPVGALFYPTMFVVKNAVSLCNVAKELGAEGFEIARDIAEEFALDAFRYIHNDKRRVCFTDAVIGVPLSFFVATAMTNSMTGAIVAIGAVALIIGGIAPLHYHLVSVRWLKLVPARH